MQHGACQLLVLMILPVIFSFVWPDGICDWGYVVFAADDGVLAPKHVADNNEYVIVGYVDFKECCTNITHDRIHPHTTAWFGLSGWNYIYLRTQLNRFSGVWSYLMTKQRRLPKSHAYVTSSRIMETEVQYIVCVSSLTHLRYKHLDLVKYVKNLVSARFVGHCCRKKMNEVRSLQRVGKFLFWWMWLRSQLTLTENYQYK